VGAHRSSGDGDVFRVGLAIARREDNARARHRRSACPVSSVCQRPRELTPTRERMGCREARHASVSSSRDGGVGVRRSSKDDRAAADRASITSTERSTSWVSVSTVSVADAGRTHLRPCGSVRESGRDDVRTLKRGVEPERDRQDVRGLVARRHSERVDARRVKPQGSRRMGAPGLDFRGVAAAVEGSRCNAQVLYACDTVEGVPV
jgi:hypothetical protein